MAKQFDIAAEKQYYSNHPPAPWKQALNKSVETLMRLTAGSCWSEYLNSKTVLELGAGECTYVPYLLSKGKPASYLASDIFEDRYSAARDSLAGEFNNLEFGVLHADKIELPDNSFDTILAFGLYHHLPDLADAFHQGHRVLRPGGVLILRDPYDGNPAIRLKYRLINRSMNEWPLNMHKTQDALRKAGFSIVSVSRFWLRFPRLSGGPWSTNIGFVAHVR